MLTTDRLPSIEAKTQPRGGTLLAAYNLGDLL